MLSAAGQPRVPIGEPAQRTTPSAAARVSRKSRAACAAQRGSPRPPGHAHFLPSKPSPAPSLSSASLYFKIHICILKQKTVGHWPLLHTRQGSGNSEYDGLSVVPVRRAGENSTQESSACKSAASSSQQISQPFLKNDLDIIFYLVWLL